MRRGKDGVTYYRLRGSPGEAGARRRCENFDEKRRFQRWLDIEVALAKSQAQLGVIPQEAAIEIARHADIEKIDIQQIKADYQKMQHSLMPLLKGLQRLCKGNLGEHIRSLSHNTQDIEDTGTILELK